LLRGFRLDSVSFSMVLRGWVPRGGTLPRASRPSPGFVCPRRRRWRPPLTPRAGAFVRRFRRAGGSSSSSTRPCCPRRRRCRPRARRHRRRAGAGRVWATALASVRSQRTEARRHRRWSRPRGRALGTLPTAHGSRALFRAHSQVRRAPSARRPCNAHLLPHPRPRALRPNLHPRTRASAGPKSFSAMSPRGTPRGWRAPGAGLRPVLSPRGGAGARAGAVPPGAARPGGSAYNSVPRCPPALPPAAPLAPAACPDTGADL
jgi:hypothetical protein